MAKKPIQSKENINKKFTITWILTALAYIGIIFFIVMTSVASALKLGNTLFFISYAGIGIFVIFGLIAHFVAKKHIDNGCKVQYYATFPCYLPLIAILFPIAIVIFIIYLFLSPSTNPTPTQKETTIYTLRTKDGFTRELIECGRDKDYDLMKHYIRYRDDLGHYWRSYDDGKHFIPE